MVDNTNPTNQFHPYQRPEDLLPPEPALSGFEKARNYVRRNAGLMLGLAVAALGLGLLRRGR